MCPIGHIQYLQIRDTFPSRSLKVFTTAYNLKIYFLLCNKKSRFDFADELKVGYVRYTHLTQITIKVQLF